MLSAICFNLDKSKILSSGNGLILTTQKDRPLENTVGKGENAGNHHFLHFPQCFLLFAN